MAFAVRDTAFFAPGFIEYQDAAGVPVAAKNTVASRIRIVFGSKQQIVTLNADGQPITASALTERE